MSYLQNPLLLYWLLITVSALVGSLRHTPTADLRAEAVIEEQLRQEKLQREELCRQLQVRVFVMFFVGWLRQFLFYFWCFVGFWMLVGFSPSLFAENFDHRVFGAVCLLCKC